jgi:hypothetical protein
MPSSVAAPSATLPRKLDSSTMFSSCCAAVYQLPLSSSERSLDEVAAKPPEPRPDGSTLLLDVLPVSRTVEPEAMTAHGTCRAYQGLMNGAHLTVALLGNTRQPQRWQHQLHILRN